MLFPSKLIKTLPKICFLFLLPVLLYSQPAFPAEPKVFFGIPFILVEPGCFQMGNPKPVNNQTVGESPSHKVCLQKAFYLGETEVTQKQWEDIMGNNPSKAIAYDKPVNRVSWLDAQEFIAKLNTKAGGKYYRLPTEAEWEFAARAGSEGDYAFGNDPKSLPQYAWFGNLGYKGSPHEVATKDPNRWGFYDMHGNVWEWVEDWFSPTYYSDSPTDNPRGPESGKYRVYRGGSFIGMPSNLRAAIRFSALPMIRTHDLGFRLARQAD